MVEVANADEHGRVGQACDAECRLAGDAEQLEAGGEEKRGNRERVVQPEADEGAPVDGEDDRPGTP